MPFLGLASGSMGYGRQVLPPQGIVNTNMLLYLDAGNPVSYPGSGTTWTDLSSNTNNATSLTGATYSSANGGYLSFNGSSGSASLVSSKYNTTYTGKTVFVAANLTGISAASYRAFLGDSAGGRNFNFYMYSPSANTYALHFSSGGSGGISSNIPYTPGTWFTAAITQATDGTLKYFFNGALVNQQSSTFAQYQSGTTEWVGRADNYWFGPLSVVCVYKAALTDAQILANHNAVRGRYGLA
jgi:hypothetical protein